MLVQSGSGRVYAVIANNEGYELSLSPELTLISTSVFLTVRCRFKALQSEVFDPILVPKSVLVGGIERSGNTLRGTVMLNTGFTVEKLGSGFPEIVADKLHKASDGFLFSPGWSAAIYPKDKRGDFSKDFAQLVETQMGPFYPPKNFSDAPDLLTQFDLMMFANVSADAPESPFKVVSDAPASDQDVIQMKPPAIPIKMEDIPDSPWD